MRVIESRPEMRTASAALRAERGTLGFVPTMGFLHQGHLHLVRAARARAGAVAMSSFVNPLQFGPGEDFTRYPRDPARDRGLAESSGVDLLWTPSQEEMYPEAPRVTVDPGPMAAAYEGAVRPGHFAGVLTVVLKLFEVVRPDVAVFGRKDVQQAALVRRMAADLDLPVEIVVASTVREADGLARLFQALFARDAEILVRLLDGTCGHLDAIAGFLDVEPCLAHLQRDQRLDVLPLLLRGTPGSIEGRGALARLAAIEQRPLHADSSREEFLVVQELVLQVAVAPGQHKLRQHA